MAEAEHSQYDSIEIEIFIENIQWQSRLILLGARYTTFDSHSSLVATRSLYSMSASAQKRFDFDMGDNRQKHIFLADDDNSKKYVIA